MGVNGLRNEEKGVSIRTVACITMDNDLPEKREKQGGERNKQVLCKSGVITTIFIMKPNGERAEEQEQSKTPCVL